MKKTFILSLLMLLSGIAARGATIDVDSLRYTLNTDGTATDWTALLGAIPYGGRIHRDATGAIVATN